MNSLDLPPYPETMANKVSYQHLQRGAKWFRYRVSIHHPLGFNLIGTPLKVLVWIQYYRCVNPRGDCYWFGGRSIVLTHTHTHTQSRVSSTDLPFAVRKGIVRSSFEVAKQQVTVDHLGINDVITDLTRPKWW